MNAKQSDRKRAPYPAWLRRLNAYEVEEAHERFWRLCEIRRAPSIGDPCRDVVWPRSEFAARAIPEGILPLDAECGFDHDVKLEMFFLKHSPRGIIGWSLEGAHYGSFAGPYNADMRSWLARELAFGTICCIAQETGLVLVADRDLRFSVIGASLETIEDLEDAFGGADALRYEFVRHIEAHDLGVGEPDSQWATEHLMPWCGWA